MLMIHLDCQRLIFDHLGLVFTSDGVGDGIIIRSEERFDLVKIKLWCRKQSFRFRLRFHRSRSSESQFVGLVSRSGRIKQSQGLRTSPVIGLFFLLCLRLRQTGFHLIVSDGVISAIGKNEDVLILATPIPSPLRLRLRLRCLIYTRS